MLAFVFEAAIGKFSTSSQTTYLQQQLFIMRSCFSYEILLNLRSMELINLKQPTFFQIRVTVYQTTKDNNHFAMPFLILNSQSNTKKLDRTSNDPANISQIDNNNCTFLTRKLIARSQDDRVDMSDMCLFKGVLEMSLAAPNKQIRLFCQLLSFQQSEVEVLAEWQGSTLKNYGSSYLPIYFASYKFTCNVNATLHCVTSSVAIESLLQNQKTFLTESKGFKKSLIFRKYSRPLEDSIQQMKQQLRLLTNHRSEIQGDLDNLFVLGPDTYRYCAFNQNKKIKGLLQGEVREIQSNIDKMQVDSFITKFKQSIHLLNQIVYQLWKKLQGLLINGYNQAYDKAIRLRYRQQIADYHKLHSVLAEGDSVVAQSQPQLFVYPFQKHDTKFKMSKDDLKLILCSKPSLKKQLIVFVHGYQASSFDMEPLSNYLKFKNPQIICLISAVNEGRTQQSIQQSAHRLAIEIKNFVNSLQLKDFQISFVCHSLGGLIGRACLKYLQLHKEKFNQFISLCSPHLGYLYHSSTLISTSLWILNKVKKDPSMIELTMSDHTDIQKTYLYGLSYNSQLGWFNRVWLFASREDQYVPYWSAILEEKSFMFQTQSAVVYNKLLKNLTNQLDNKILRCQIVFNEKTNDLSNFIGRTAHIKMLNYLPAIQLFSFIFTP